MRTKPSDGVVLVAVIAWISGILQLFSGAVMLWSGGSAVTGWLHIVIGLVTFPVCLGLFRARTSARMCTSSAGGKVSGGESLRRSSQICRPQLAGALRSRAPTPVPAET